MKDTTALTPSPRQTPYETGAGTQPLPPSRRSTHVSRACATCRRRKTKCDGVQPTCGTCSVHNTECEYSAEPDRRKTRDAHAAIASLSNRVEELHGQVEGLQRQLHGQVEGLERQLSGQVEGLHGQVEGLERGMRSLLTADDQEYPLLSCTVRAVAGDMNEDDYADISFVIRAKKSSVCSQ
ncbi:hypothetical protein AURDEDRAFT_114273 [Auricularia subglabra TFB-10046 SS5]|nr:hypothetical protein AURDEDRAFT_114273 [Auricularia subglabra TFB-10046 SS5]